jgi:RNAse (barnase) inhibitor barstar
MHDVAVAFESIEEAKRDLVAAMKLADDYLVHQLDECYDVLVRIAAWLESYGFESVDRQNTRREAIARACVLAQKDLENIFPDLRAQ